MAPALLTKREAAQRARVHVGTLNQLIREGRGPVLTRVGRKALIREDRFADWLEQGTEQRPLQAAE